MNGNRSKAAREQLTLIRIYEELCSLGYEGGYDAVRRYARNWSKAQGSATADAYVPLFFAPGEAYQFDWSHEIVVINGATTQVKVAHVRLCHSRMLFVRAYPRESQEMVFDAHDKAFAFFGPGRMAADIAAGQATLAAITGQTPRYFRATAGLRNPFLDPVLHRLGIRLAAWTRRPYDTRCGDPETVLARLCRNLGPGDILLLHDGHAARTADGQPVILAVLPRLLATLRDQQLNPVTLNDATT